jgi:tRNA-dihydrouridine synthase B
MKIGNLNLSSKAMLAPMAEVTDAPFRQICKEYGAGLTFTQMISAKGIVENSFASLKSLAFNRSEKPIAVQLLANDPEYLKKAIYEIKQLKPDLIDLNCGCSVQQVCKYGLGASLLDDPALLSKLVKTMVNAAGDVPVSIKIRLGRDNKNITVLRNAKIIEDNGASAVIVHGRTRSQAYDEPSDWSWIKKVKDEVKIPVIGNGSIFEPEDAVRMIEQTNCDFVFISRGALGNPFIFKRINSFFDEGTEGKAPEIDEVGNAAIRHLKMIIKDSGESNGVIKARKHLIWYFRFYNGIRSFIEKIFTIDNSAQVELFILDHVKKIKTGFYPEEDLQKVRKSFNERVLFWINDNKPVTTE